MSERTMDALIMVSLVALLIVEFAVIAGIAWWWIAFLLAG